MKKFKELKIDNSIYFYLSIKEGLYCNTLFKKHENKQERIAKNFADKEHVISFYLIEG